MKWLEARVANDGWKDRRGDDEGAAAWLVFGDAGLFTESHGETEAERLAGEALVVLGVSRERKDLEEIRKGDRAKVLIAALLIKNDHCKQLHRKTIEHGAAQVSKSAGGYRR